MKEISYEITDEIGIHARPAGLLVKIATKFDSEIKICKGEKMADAKKIFSVMGLGVKNGEKITISAKGKDEDEAISEIEKFMRENL